MGKRGSFFDHPECPRNDLATPEHRHSNTLATILNSLATQQQVLLLLKFSFWIKRVSKNVIVFRGYTYYKMGNLDNRIANADQLLTQDVERFCNSVVDLYSNLSKVKYMSLSL